MSAAEEENSTDNDAQDGRAAGVVSKREEGDLLSTEEDAFDEEEMARAREIEKQGSAVVSMAKGLAGRAVLWSFLYLLGFNKWNLFPWLLVPVSIGALWEIKDLIRKRSSKVSKWLRYEEASPKHLPRWVHYPDYHRAEWLNKIMAQLWPAVQDHLKSQLDFRIAGFLQLSTRIGAIPPRFGGIKVYTRTSRQEVILDADVSWASDCDVSVVAPGFEAAAAVPSFLAVREVYLRGILRIKLRPLMKDVPFFSNVVVSFLHPPELDFDLGGAANLFDFPGLIEVAKSFAMEAVVAPLMLLPNGIVVPMVETDQAAAELGEGEEVNKIAHFTPLELLRVRVVRATNLMAKDIHLFGKNTSDPYIKVRLGSWSADGAQTIQSATVKKTTNPVWNMDCQFAVQKGTCGVAELTPQKGAQVPSSTDEESDSLELTVWDYDKGPRADDFLGKISVPLSLLGGKAKTESWFTLDDADSGKVCLRSELLKLEDPSDDEDSDDEEEANEDALPCETMADAAPPLPVLQVYVDHIKNLPNNKTNRAPNPAMTLQVSGEPVQCSEQVLCCRDPVYEQEFRFRVTSAESDNLTIKVHDLKTKDPLGVLRLDISDLLLPSAVSTGRSKCQPVKLKESSPDCYVLMAMKLLIPKRA